jgi:hypothetical protein
VKQKAPNQLIFYGPNHLGILFNFGITGCDVPKALTLCGKTPPALIFKKSCLFRLPGQFRRQSSTSGLYSGKNKNGNNIHCGYLKRRIMKKYYAITLLALAMLDVQGQDYFISFAGSGAANTVGTVKVENLTSGETVTLNGGDILHLIPSLGIGAVGADHRYLHLYPNPMVEQSTLDFVAPASGTSAISLVNLSGQTVCQISEELTRGAHSFRVSGINQGIYFVKVAGVNYNYSAKLMSQSNLQAMQ